MWEPAHARAPAGARPALRCVPYANHRSTILRDEMARALLLDLYDTLVYPDWTLLLDGRDRLAARAGVQQSHARALAPHPRAAACAGTTAA